MGYAADSMGTLGILGGGQLARMTALAARALGYRVQALDPNPQCPVSGLVDRMVEAGFDDVEAALSLAQGCDAVTVDLENIAIPLLESVAALRPLRPGVHVMHLVQDRGRQKQWLHDQGFPVGPFGIAEGEQALKQLLEALGDKCYVKAAGGGFDGRGQCIAHPDSDPHVVLSQVGCERVTVELGLSLKAELSVLVARRPSGEMVVYPPALNHHEQGVLSFSLLPAPLPARVLAAAEKLAARVTSELDATGVCVVEMFLMADDSLLVNEIAPRPHNSYHGSERAFETSQFEQHVRAVFDLPLGSVTPTRPTAMANLLGELWLSDTAPELARALDVPSVRTHLYGKAVARPGRKVGHLTATGATVHEAMQRVLEARSVLSAARPPRGARQSPR